MYWGFDLVMGFANCGNHRGLPCVHVVLMERALVRKVSQGAQSVLCRLSDRRHRGDSTGCCGAARSRSRYLGSHIALGATPDPRTAMLYSLSAITSYGHSAIFLEERWKLLSAIEAMNGLMVFGLTTAFLFAAIELVRPDRRR